MQWVLERLRGRLGIAAVIVLVVLTAVGIGRALGGGSSGSDLPALGSETAPATAPSDADDGVEGGPAVKPPEASVSAGAAEPLKVATDFLTAWLRGDLTAAQWHDGISPYATPALADKLSGVDPAGVPAERTTGEPELIPRGAGAVAVSVPVDSGKVDLRVVVVDGRWLVDGVDWSRE